MSVLNTSDWSSQQLPLPAHVVKFPLASIFLITLLSVSAKYIFPAESLLKLPTWPENLEDVKSSPSKNPVFPSPRNSETLLISVDS